VIRDNTRVMCRSRRPWSPATRTAAAVIATAILALPAAACGGSSGSRVAQLVSTATQSASSPRSPAQHAQLESEYLSFARCMRSHGVSDFPDPVTGSGGHPGFHLQGGSNSDLNQNSPALQRGVEACQHILGHHFRFVFTPRGVGKGA
jgi:hypothetical protein